MKGIPRSALWLSGAALALGGTSARAADIIWWAPNWGEARARELAQKFEAANPGDKVKIEVTVSDGLQNRVLVALKSGSPPDLIEIQNGWNIPFAATGALMPLDDIYARNKIDTADFAPAALNLSKFDGKIYGIPYRIEAHAIYYNKGAYKEAGLDPSKPPKTWPELVDVAKKLTKTVNGKPQYGFGITGGGEFGNTAFRSVPFIWMNGGSLLSDDMKQVIVNQKPAVEAVEFYTNMLTKEKVSPPSTLQNDGTALRRLFIAGTVAQYQSGQFDLDSIKKENPSIEIGVMPIPTPPGKTPAALLGGWTFVVPAGSKNKDGAAKLIAFLAQTDNMGFYTDTFPARTSSMSLPRFQAPELQAFKEMLPFARPAPPHRNWVQITQVYFNNIQRVLLGETTAQKAMDDAASEIKSLLD
ncbi:ABC transporter substrate-binding protein [Terrarubrum flagellatum]|uniref:ABC transporter substrate-binding protein n=1 Tax=Terrirubrum flagellatum TaxID=2895980 RepID=UPI003144D9DD